MATITIKTPGIKARALRISLMACLCLTSLSACSNEATPARQPTHPANAPSAAATQTLTATIQATPQLEDVRRLGINLGQWTYWGAEQLGRNILMNPGFEGIVDRSLVRVTQPGRSSFSDDERWLGRDDGFWRHATFEVITGSAVGSRGALIDSRKQGRHELPEYFPRSMPAGLTEGDIIALTKVDDAALPSHWWFSDASTGRFSTDQTQQRPDSPGKRALRIQPLAGQTAWLASHLDTIGDRAGKLKPVNGPWVLSAWIHGDDKQATNLRISFRRHGNAPFLDVTLQAEVGWQRLEYPFSAADNGPVGPLEFRLEVSGGTLSLDDVWLGPQGEPSSLPAPAHTGFSPEVIALLEQLRPGYLRDWQGQLGDTLENRLAPAFARRASRYRPDSPFYLYGLDEFLALNQHIGANPWLVMPTTFTPDEARALGVWLAQRIDQHAFSEVLVEFGNENWNGVFRPAGIQDPRHHGFAADRLFQALREGAGHHPALRTVINGQHANPDYALAFDRHSTEADMIAVAPYLLHRLDQADTGTAIDAMFRNDEGRMQKLADGLDTQRELAVYEVNLHVTAGDATEADRNALITSPAAGAALAKRLLEGLASGATRQSLYRLTGFDTPLTEGKGLVRLFGITRNLHEADALRPSGWAMVMLNRVIQPRMHVAELSGVERSGAVEPITVAGFSGDQGWTAAIVSAAPQAQTLTIHFPADQQALPTRAEVFAGLPAHFDGQEAPIAPAPADWQQTGPRSFELVVPAYCLVILQP